MRVQRGSADPEEFGDGAHRVFGLGEELEGIGGLFWRERGRAAEPVEADNDEGVGHAADGVLHTGSAC